MSNKSLGQRIRAARNNAGLSQAALGTAVAKLTKDAGYTASAVGQWEMDKHEPSVPALLAIAKITGADAAYLIIGKAAAELGKSGQLPRGGRIVPKVSAVQAVAGVGGGPASGESVHTHFDCSDQAFAMPIFDGRNAPDFLVGDNVVIDPLAEPTPGDMVLARIDGRPVFGVYTRVRGGGVEIAAENSRWSPEAMQPERGDVVVGVMTEHAKPRQQQTSAETR